MCLEMTSHSYLFDSSLFLTKLDENLICGICLGVLNDPHQCQNGHSYCRTCVEEYLDDCQKPCPMRCTAILYSTNDLIKNRALAGIIDNLVIRCPTTFAGGDCTWTGTTSSWYTHQLQCLFEEVTCDLDECCDAMLRKDLTQHKENCLFRKLPCMWCNTLFSRNQLLTHCCEEEVLPCPHACVDLRGNEMQCLRRDMSNHLLYHCPEEVMACPFTPLGCRTKLPRKEMLYHEQNSAVIAHQTMLLSKVLEQEQKLVQQQKTIKELGGLAFTEIIFSIQNFNRSQLYSSPTVEFLGRSFQVSFSSNMTNKSYHNIVLKCFGDLPTHVKSLTGYLHQQQSTLSTRAPISTLLLVEKTVRNVYFPPLLSSSSLPTLSSATAIATVTADTTEGDERFRDRDRDATPTSYYPLSQSSQLPFRGFPEEDGQMHQRAQRASTSAVPLSFGAAWELSNFIKTEELLSCVEDSPGKSLIISVKMSVLC